MKSLMTEKYKFLNYLSPPTMNDIFQKQQKLILFKKHKVAGS